MAAHQPLEDNWGTAAAYAEHQIGDYIRYHVEGQVRSGSIVWICAPGEQQGQLRSVRYIVQPENSDQSPDVIWPGNILMSDPHAAASEAPSSVAEWEQALTELCATLSIPIVIHPEIDDSGQPFYVWHIGESTSQQPWGRFVGTERHLFGALKLALETLIKHVELPPPASEA